MIDFCVWHICWESDWSGLVTPANFKQIQETHTASFFFFRIALAHNICSKVWTWLHQTTSSCLQSPGVALALKIGGQNCHFYQFEYSATMIIYGKKDPQNNLECKFVHPNQNLCVMDPLTPHNATPGQAIQLQEQLLFPQTSASSAKRCTEAARRAAVEVPTDISQQHQALRCLRPAISGWLRW